MPGGRCFAFKTSPILAQTEDALLDRSVLIPKADETGEGILASIKRNAKRYSHTGGAFGAAGSVNPMFLQSELCCG